MSFQYVREMPGVSDILESIPVADDLKEIKEKRDREIKAVFERESEKFLVIIGPCSADNEDSVCEYVSKLARLQDEVKEKLILIPRIYTNAIFRSSVKVSSLLAGSEQLDTVACRGA